jgi:hypothetical protein
MAKFKPQHQRLLFIDREIRKGRFPNCRTLAEEWEVSRKSIQRDIEYMRYQLDASIEYSRRKGGYYYTEAQYSLPAMDIRESDLSAIYLAQKLLEQYEGTPVYEKLCTVFGKIEDSLPEKITMRNAGEQEKFTIIPPFTTSICPETWDVMVRGLRDCLSVDMVCKVPGRGPLKRRIDPYHAVRYQGDFTWSVSATSGRRYAPSVCRESGMHGSPAMASQSLPVSTSRNMQATISACTGPGTRYRAGYASMQAWQTM